MLWAPGEAATERGPALSTCLWDEQGGRQGRSSLAGGGGPRARSGGSAWVSLTSMQKTPLPRPGPESGSSPDTPPEMGDSLPLRPPVRAPPYLICAVLRGPTSFSGPSACAEHLLDAVPPWLALPTAQTPSPAWGGSEGQRHRGAAWLFARIATSPETRLPLRGPHAAAGGAGSSRGLNSSFSRLLSPEMSLRSRPPAWWCIQGAPSVDGVGGAREERREGREEGERSGRRGRGGRWWWSELGCRLPLLSVSVPLSTTVKKILRQLGSGEADRRAHV